MVQLDTLFSNVELPSLPKCSFKSPPYLTGLTSFAERIDMADKVTQIKGKNLTCIWASVSCSSLFLSSSSISIMSNTDSMLYVRRGERRKGKGRGREKGEREKGGREGGRREGGREKGGREGEGREGGRREGGREKGGREGGREGEGREGGGREGGREGGRDKDAYMYSHTHMYRQGDNFMWQHCILVNGENSCCAV